jgi:hypothetical protein
MEDVASISGVIELFISVLQNILPIYICDACIDEGGGGVNGLG